MKKILILLAFILTVSSTSFATFSDMVKNETYVTAINNLVDKKIINGYEDNTFRPNGKITRAEFSKMIVLAKNISVSKENNFSDVATNHWAKEYINSLYNSNLITGYEDGTFKPEKNITYGEMATILVRAMELEKEAQKLNVAWPLDYFSVATKVGLFEGWNTNDLVPENPATRANTALMIWNMLKIESTIDAEVSQEINTKLSYSGLVTGTKIRAGINYITVDNGYEELEYELPSKTTPPEIGSFIIHQLASDGKLKLIKEISLDDKESDTLLVEKIDKDFIKFKDVDKELDSMLENYELDSKKIKIQKINYFVLEFEDDEFTSFELTRGIEKLKFEKNDLVKFDEKLNVCYIFREV